MGDVQEEEDAEDAELQASIASANKWRKMAALTRQRAAEVFMSALKLSHAIKKIHIHLHSCMFAQEVNLKHNITSEVSTMVTSYLEVID